MSKTPKYYMVSTQVLPEIFIKVMETKAILAQGRAKNLSEATRMTGISRSAFYKYKDDILPVESRNTSDMVTLSATLRDEPGILSSVINALYIFGANILTVNQNIPVDAVAVVTVSANIANLTVEIGELIAHIRALEGVVEAQILAANS